MEQREQSGPMTRRRIPACVRLPLNGIHIKRSAQALIHLGNSVLNQSAKVFQTDTRDARTPTFLGGKR